MMLSLLESDQGEGRLEVCPSPWKRYFARMLDLGIYGLIWEYFANHILRWNTSLDGWITIVGYIVPLVLMILIEPILLVKWGTTPGKRIFGFQIRDSQGRLLSWEEAWRRTLDLFALGMGYGIPFYIWYRQFKSYEPCSDEEVMEWDRGINYQVKDEKGWRIALMIATNVVLFAVTFFMLIEAQMPINRGEVSKAEFFENYNDLEQFYTDKPSSGTIIYQPGKEQRGFKIIENDGVVTEVRLDLEYTDQSEWVSNHADRMVFGILAYAGAQKEMSFLKLDQSGIFDDVGNEEIKEFRYVLGDIAINYEVEYTGYHAFGGFFMPSEGGQNYFRMEFVMKKID